MKSVLSKIAVLSVAVVAAFALSSCGGSKEAKVITINGSTTVNPIIQKATEVYEAKNKNVKFSVKGTGSGDGIKALIDATTEIAMASRNIKDKEVKMAEENGIDVQEYVIGADMIVPVVHPNNPVNGLTAEQLRKIYTGDIKNWKEVGGKDLEIVVISRESSSGTFGVWNKKILEKKYKVRQDADYQKTNPGVAQAVAGNEQAIGYVGLGFVSDMVKGISVDGVEPTIANVKSYKVARSLHLYVDKNKISPEAQKFIDFVMGPEGQKIVEEKDFIPLEK